MVATAAVAVALSSGLEVWAFACLLAAIALDVGRFGAAQGPAVLALRDGTALLVNVLQLTVYRNDVSVALFCPRLQKFNAGHGQLKRTLLARDDGISAVTTAADRGDLNA